MIKRMVGVLSALILASAGVAVFAASAQATTVKLSASHEMDCGTVTVTFVNNTAHTYSADVRFDGAAGVDDAFTNYDWPDSKDPDGSKTGLILGGPHAGQPFGQRFDPLPLPPGETTKTVTFGEDTGVHTVQYRIWRGPENDFYVPWSVVVSVESDCKDPEPEPSVSPSPSLSVSPTLSAGPEPSASETTAAPGVAGGGDEPSLPVTGAPTALLISGALALLAIGGVLFAVTRKRRIRTVA